MRFFLLLLLAACDLPHPSNECPSAESGWHNCGRCSITDKCVECPDGYSCDADPCAEMCHGTTPTCPSSAPLQCNAGWCCPYGNGGRTDVCCDNNPQSSGCTTNGTCGTTTTCPSNAPLHCNAGWCCPYGNGGRTDVCCDTHPSSSGCTTNGTC
jgi:hypothetical protein